MRVFDQTLQFRHARFDQRKPIHELPIRLRSSRCELQHGASGKIRNVSRAFEQARNAQALQLVWC